MESKEPEPTSGEAPREAGSAIPQPGEVLDGRYRIEGTIGQGNMAVVLEATHLHLHDRVAIKLMLPQWAEDPELVERFMREGRAATKIRSEHVVRVFDVGIVAKHPYLVMEYLEGSDLDRLIADEGPLTPSLAIDYLLQAGEAIAEAHVSGIIHRDLKPANLFLTRRADGSPCIKVLDFGISKATRASITGMDLGGTQPTAVLGSPHYMSPEQMLSSRDVDARSDLWALGAILHELITGAAPFDAETMAALSAVILRDPAPPLSSLRPETPPEVEAAVLRCLEKEPSKRFRDVAELAAALAPYGSAAARASATRIARVLDAGAGQVSAPRPPVSTEPVSQSVRVAPPEASTLPSVVVRPARSRVFGYVVGSVALLVVAMGIGSMIVKSEHAVRAQQMEEEAGAAAASAPAPTSAIPSVFPSAAASAASSAMPSASSASNASSAEAATHGANAHANAPSARPAPRAKPPRRPARGQPPPLPDFPVPRVTDEPPSPPVAPAAPPAPTSSAP